MLVSCEECNYENLPQHTFCGMCGAKLPSARRVEARAAEKAGSAASAQSFSRPSLLGLAADDEPTETERITYLLEDEPTENRGRLLVLLLLLAAIVGSAWHWRTEVRAWIAREGKNPSLAQDAGTSANAAPAVATPEAASPSATASQNPAASPQPAAANDGAAQKAATAPPAPAPSDEAAKQPGPAVTDAAKRQPEPQEQPDQADNATAAVAKPALKPAVADMTQKPAARNASADALETQGEDYLYGRGVQANCSRAGKSLLAAAAQSSAKAQSVLGTMYATGHCVTRDVPVAYRWFAKASRQEPNNTRLQQDLKALWRQMTPEEQQIAMAAER